MMPANGAVFALDGILIGAGDTRFLMWGMLAAAAVYVPVALLALHEDWGIRGRVGGARRADRGPPGHLRRALPRPAMGAHRRAGVVPSPPSCARFAALLPASPCSRRPRRRSRRATRSARCRPRADADAHAGHRTTNVIGQDVGRDTLY